MEGSRSLLRVFGYLGIWKRAFKTGERCVMGEENEMHCATRICTVQFYSPTNVLIYDKTISEE